MGIWALEEEDREAAGEVLVRQMKYMEEDERCHRRTEDVVGDSDGQDLVGEGEFLLLGTREVVKRVAGVRFEDRNGVRGGQRRCKGGWWKTEDGEG